MIYYLIVFAASFIVDLIPAFGPPAWSVMVLMQVKFDLNIWPVLFCGVSGSALGRYLLAKLIVPQLSESLLRKQKNDELKFLGDKLNQEGWGSVLFVFIYTLIPIPTGPLFLVAGIARMKAWYLIPPFFIGKFISDSLMVMSGHWASEYIDANGWSEVFSWQSMGTLLIGFLLVSFVLFTDWKVLLMKHKWKLNFRIFKSSKSVR